jgi:pimeloyl-ACP methyl ester carboxylesterase
VSTSVVNESALTAVNRAAQIEGATLVYRRFGNPSNGAPPLLFLQHFRGNLDTWDPALVDELARQREVVLLDNRGVGASTGAVPDNVEDTARNVLRFVDALGLTEIDVLGFSLGGFVAQTLALTHPRLIRRLVLAGTAPQGASSPASPRGRPLPTSRRTSRLVTLSSPRSPAGVSRSRRSSLGSERSRSRRWSRTGTTTR